MGNEKESRVDGLAEERRAALIADMKQKILDPLSCVNLGATNLAISLVESMKTRPDLYDQDIISSILNDPEIVAAVKKVLAYFLPYLNGEERNLSERLSDSFNVQLSVAEKQAGIEDFLLRYYLKEGYLNIEYIDALAANLGIDLSPGYFSEDRIQTAVRNGLIRHIKQDPNIFDPRTARMPIDAITDDLIRRFSLSEATMKALGVAFLEKATFEIRVGRQSEFLTEFMGKVATKFALTQDEIKDVGRRYIFKKSKEWYVFENGGVLDDNPVSNVAKAYNITDEELKKIILEGTLAGIAKYIVMNGDFETFKEGLAFWGIDVEAVLKSDKFFAAVVNHVIGEIALREKAIEGPFGHYALLEYQLMKAGEDPVKAIFKAIERVFGEDGEDLMILNLRVRGGEDHDIEQFRKNLKVLQKMRRSGV